MQRLSWIGVVLTMPCAYPAAADIPLRFRTVAIRELPPQVRQVALLHHAISARRFSEKPDEPPSASVYWLLLSQRMISPHVCLREVAGTFEGDPPPLRSQLEMVRAARCPPQLDDNGVTVGRELAPTPEQFVEMDNFASELIKSKGRLFSILPWNRCDSGTMAKWFRDSMIRRPQWTPRLSSAVVLDGWLGTKRYNMTIDGNFAINAVKLPGLKMRVVNCYTFVN